MSNWYFISYSYRKSFFRIGTGCITLCFDFNPYTDIAKVATGIETISKCKKVVLLNIQFVRNE